MKEYAAVPDPLLHETKELAKYFKLSLPVREGPQARGDNQGNR
jgi:hypothetical protein